MQQAGAAQPSTAPPVCGADGRVDDGHVSTLPAAGEHQGAACHAHSCTHVHLRNAAFVHAHACACACVHKAGSTPGGRCFMLHVDEGVCS